MSTESTTRASRQAPGTTGGFPPGSDVAPPPETDRLVRVTRAAIRRAKERGAAEVTPDDLLLAILRALSRFGVALIGPWAFDVEALEKEDAERASCAEGDAAAREDGRAEGGGTGPRYAAGSVALFERAAGIAREDGALSLGLIHLLVAFGAEETGLMGRLRDRHAFTPLDWRAALAREPAGLPPAIAGLVRADGDGADGAAPSTPDLLSVEQAAAFLGVHSQTVRNYIRGGKLPAYRVAGERVIRVLRRDLLALLEPVPSEDA